MHSRLCRSISATLLVAALSTTALAFDIPHLMPAAIDGNLEDWAGKAFAVEVFTDKDGKYVPRADFHPRLFLAWDGTGILVGLDVVDDTFVEQPGESTLWDGDSVEIFVSETVGSDNMVHLVVSPGMTAEFPELRSKVYGFRTAAPAHTPEVTVVRQRTDTGYTLEAHIAASSLGLKLEGDAELGFQIFFNDVDGRHGRYQAIWYPQTRAHENPDRVHPITLARNAGDPVLARIRAGYDDFARGYVDVVTVPEWAGRAVEAKSGRKAVAGGTLEADQGWATARIGFPFPASTEPLESLAVRVGRTRLPEIELPDAEEIRARKLMDIELAFASYVFRNAAFPSCDFKNPLLAERLIGPYTLDAEFFDAAFQPVESADAIGRYGAVITVTPKDGLPFTRYQTLCRAPDSFSAYTRRYFEHNATMKWPSELALDPIAIDKQTGAVSGYLADVMTSAFSDDARMAVLVAALLEDREPGPARTVADDAFARDRQWWVTWKRQSNGMAATFPNAFDAPRPIDGTPATVLRDGTPEEARMNPAVAASLDGVLQEWWEKSKEPFAVCVARDGVVFYQKAFGDRDGTPMTVDRPSWIASISKFMSGTLMMMLVDQGLVDLDDRVDTYLPPLRDVPVERPLIIRNLYTHTNGLMLGGFAYRGSFPDHWGDALNDLEEVIAGYYPRLKVGQAHAYNGVGYAVGGKVIEQVTGEAIPQFYQKHLLDPLGMTHTAAIDTSAYIFSTPRDLAAWGQMLLNKGAYGDMRFFSEATFEKMTPQSLKPILGPDTEIEWGIGMLRMHEEGLSDQTFGHGAASAATFRIDPVNNLVITMTRNNAGAYYGDYHPKFIEAIASNLAP